MRGSSQISVFEKQSSNLERLHPIFSNTVQRTRKNDGHARGLRFTVSDRALRRRKTHRWSIRQFVNIFLVSFRDTKAALLQTLPDTFLVLRPYPVGRTKTVFRHVGNMYEANMFPTRFMHFMCTCSEHLLFCIMRAHYRTAVLMYVSMAHHSETNDRLRFETKRTTVLSTIHTYTIETGSELPGSNALAKTGALTLSNLILSAVFRAPGRVTAALTPVPALFRNGC